MDMNLTYITYQTFPAFTANSIQTMTHIKYFSKLKMNVKLIFPLRNKESNSDLLKLKNFYQIDENFEVHGTIHPLPFKKVNFFEKFNYLFSHLVWSYFVTRKYSKSSDSFFTRSEWVFYFLSKRKLNVVFECHQLSRLKKRLILASLKNENSRLILLNNFMLDELKLSENEKVIILPSGFDEDLFSLKGRVKKSRKIIYAGSFFRFGKSRGLEHLLESFQKLKKLEIETILVSNDEKDIQFLKEIAPHSFDQSSVTFYSGLQRKEIAQLFKECAVGILINNDSKHAEKYTSPLKYFEYLSCGLNVVASNNKAHKTLPFQNNIVYFNKNKENSFIDAVKLAINSNSDLQDELNAHYSMSSRVKKIKNLLS